MTPIKVERSKEGAHSSSLDLLGTEVTTIRELIDRMVEMQPKATFLVSPDMGEVLTFLGLQEQSEVLSARLQQWGLERGDKVAFLMDNSLFAARLFLGVMYGGLVSVPLNVHAGVTQLSYMVEHCDAKVVFVDDEHAALMTEVMIQVRRPVRVIPCDADNLAAMHDTTPPRTQTAAPSPEDV